jgi:hypothetical protein
MKTQTEEQTHTDTETDSKVISYTFYFFQNEESRLKI